MRDAIQRLALAHPYYGYRRIAAEMLLRLIHDSRFQVNGYLAGLWYDSGTTRSRRM